MRLLLIDDDVELCALLIEFLKREGFELLVEHEGRRGFERAAAGGWDLVILDVMLPKKPGFQVLRELRQEKVATPVLLLTARDTVEDKVQGLDAGADDYLTKPFDVRNIREAVARMMDRRALHQQTEHNLRRLQDLEQQYRSGANTMADDARAKLMRKVCGEVLSELGLQNDRLFKLAMELEKIALEDDYFVEKKLYPNVDFYSGIVQKAIGIPTEMFTCIFALARTVGWMTQWEEMLTDSEYKIGRPRQLYVGAAKRDVVPLAQRG